MSASERAATSEEAVSGDEKDTVSESGTSASAESNFEVNGIGSSASAIVSAAPEQPPTFSPDPKLLASANKIKAEGNELFMEGHFSEASEVYTEAIKACPTAVLYANRAMCYLKTESFGLAREDALQAIKLDPTYVKGYYRLGSAHAALSHYKEALKVFKKVVRLAPKDRDARVKFKQVDKEVKRRAFEEAIHMEPPPPMSQTMDVSSINVPDSYDGPRLDEDDKVTKEFVEAMVQYMKEQKTVHKKYIASMLIQLKRLFESLPSLIEVETPKDSFFTVCGDTHGQFYDLLNIFEINGGLPTPERPYLFNGDFVDRGSFSFEVVMTLMAFKLLYPGHMHMLRGNHETKNMNKIYGFEGEVKSKYDEQIMELFTEVFQWLPLCATINKKVVVMHGGLFQKDGVKLDEIRKVERNMEPPESGLMSDILWSDPQPFPGRGPSKRGVGLSFGPDITKKFLDDNGLELLVRSHEVKDEGYLQEHDGKLITVFSAPNYCDQMGNKGALIRFRNDCKPEFVQFEAVPHPDIKPMAYANNMGMFGF